jgi:hypothetical protein
MSPKKQGWPYLQINKFIGLEGLLCLDLFGIAVALTTCYFVVKKKRSLRDVLVNVSYSRISDLILDLVTVSMILFCIQVLGNISLLYAIT